MLLGYSESSGLSNLGLWALTWGFNHEDRSSTPTHKSKGSLLIGKVRINTSTEDYQEDCLSQAHADS